MSHLLRRLLTGSGKLTLARASLEPLPQGSPCELSGSSAADSLSDLAFLDGVHVAHKLGYGVKEAPDIHTLPSRFSNRFPFGPRKRWLVAPIPRRHVARRLHSACGSSRTIQHLGVGYPGVLSESWPATLTASSSLFGWAV